MLSNLDDWNIQKDQKVINIVGTSFEWAIKNNMVWNANVSSSAVGRLQLDRTLKQAGITHIAKVFENEGKVMDWLKKEGL